MRNRHCLSVDLESWIFSKSINAQNLSVAGLRRLDNKYTLKALDYLLRSFKKHRQKTTFFVVTKFEELYPGILEKISKEGHEIGWHSHSHVQIDNIDILKRELMLGEKYFKKHKIKGFQAPGVIFFRKGYQLLKKAGFLYSSSIYGNSQRIYNFDGVYEIPVSVSNENYQPKREEISFPGNLTLKAMLKFGIPYGSSFFWGILGKRYYEKKLREMEKKTKTCNLFIHEWQVVTPKSKEYQKDVNFFRIPLFLPYRINVAGMFKYLLSKFKFQPLINLVKDKFK